MVKQAVNCCVHSNYSICIALSSLGIVVRRKKTARVHLSAKLRGPKNEAIMQMARRPMHLRTRQCVTVPAVQWIIIFLRCTIKQNKRAELKRHPVHRHDGKHITSDDVTTVLRCRSATDRKERRAAGPCSPWKGASSLHNYQYTCTYSCVLW